LIAEVSADAGFGAASFRLIAANAARLLYAVQEGEGEIQVKA